MALMLKRAYDKATSQDGTRVLVDRLWPRGLAKAEARIDLWMKEVAPSDALRKWFGHDPARWEEFRRRYMDELSERPEVLDRLRGLVRGGDVTLVYAAKDQDHNNAVVLKAVLGRRRGSGRRGKDGTDN